MKCTFWRRLSIFGAGEKIISTQYFLLAAIARQTSRDGASFMQCLYAGLFILMLQCVQLEILHVGCVVLFVFQWRWRATLIQATVTSFDRCLQLGCRGLSLVYSPHEHTTPRECREYTHSHQPTQSINYNTLCELCEWTTAGKWLRKNLCLTEKT